MKLLYEPLTLQKLIDIGVCEASVGTEMREEDVEALYNLDTYEDVKRYVGGALTQRKSLAT